MEINGEVVKAELLDATKARQLYEDIVRKSLDPALFEYANRGLFKIRIFPIEPHSKQEIRVFGSTTIPYYFTRDHLGSVREVANQGGVIAQSFDYTAWGERTSSTAGSLEWGLTGHHYHEKSGLCLAMYRAYDAKLGRWLSEDPLGLNEYDLGGGYHCRTDSFHPTRGGGFRESPLQKWPRSRHLER
jgi:RHS repeat-associated protein